MIESINIKKDMILKACCDLSVEIGWHDASIMEKASIKAGYSSGMGLLLFPDAIQGVISYYFTRITETNLSLYQDHLMHSSLERLAITQSINLYIHMILDTMEMDREAISLAVDYCDTIKNLKYYTQEILWKMSNIIWHDIVHDKSLDYNFYSKRILLSLALKLIIFDWQEYGLDYAKNNTLLRLKKISSLGRKFSHFFQSSNQ